MPSLKTVTSNQICPLVTLLRDAPKPIPYDEFPALFERLGWVKDRKRGGKSNYDINLPMASVGQQRGEISRLSARVSDTIAEEGPASRAAVKEVFPEVTRSISECIGYEPTGTPLHYEGMDWDLEDGSLIRLIPADDVIEFMFMSKDIADNERFERQYGINLDDELERPQE